MRSNTLPTSLYALLVAVALAGCQAARVEQPLTTNLGADDPDTQLEFWHSLAQQPVTSNDDAFHGLLLFLDGADPGPDYAARVATLKDRGLVPKSFDAPADQAVERGTVAVALSKVLDVRGGIMMSLSPQCPRYATKELVYLGIYPPSSPNQTFSGTEYLGIIGKAEDYQRVERSGTARPLDSIQPENAPQGGRSELIPDKQVQPVPGTP